MGLVHCGARELLDIRRHRCREQKRLSFCRQDRQNSPNRRQETHIEHAISFVEYENFDAREIDCAAVHKIE